MPTIDGINVRILSNEIAYEEHADPECDDTIQHVSRYIEVEGGQQFVVQVQLSEQFNFHGANCLKWSLYVDGKRASRSHVASQRLFEKETRRGRPVITLDSGEVVYNHQSQLWQRFPREFGTLQLLERAEDSTISIEALMSPTADEVRNLGLIRVVARRLCRRRLEGTTNYNTKRQLPEVSTEIMKKKLVESRRSEDKFINNTVKFGAGIPIEGSLSKSQHQYLAVVGVAGQEYEFLFKYRDRKLLQNLGIINAEKMLQENDRKGIPTQRDEEIRKLHKELLEEKNREIRLLRVELEKAKGRGQKRTASADVKEEEAGSHRNSLEPSKRSRSTAKETIETIDLLDDSTT